MYDSWSESRTRPIETPLDAVEEWLEGAGRWPLRILVAAVLCPIIISFGGHTRFLFYWDQFTRGGQMGSHTWVSLTPLFAIGLLIGSRFLQSLQARSVCCALSGLTAVGIFSLCTHWALAGFAAGLILVAAGNRAAKQFTVRRAPRVAAAIGGGMVLLLGCLDVNGSSLIGTLFTGSSWARGGWMLCLGLLGVLAFALAGVGLAIPRLRRDVPSRVISITARLTLAWAPACLIFGRISLGGSFSGLDASVDLAGATIAFKVFGIAYPILIVGASGVASWATVGMWNAMDAQVTPEGVPPELGEVPEERPEPVMTMAGAPDGR